MYIMLLDTYFSLHLQPLQLVCLTDRWSIKLNRLINNVFLRVPSISEASKVQCESTQWKVQYMAHDSSTENTIQVRLRQNKLIQGMVLLVHNHMLLSY